MSPARAARSGRPGARRVFVPAGSPGHGRRGIRWGRTAWVPRPTTSSGNSSRRALDKGDLLGIQVVLDDDGLERREVLVLLDAAAKGFFIDLEEPADRGQGRFEVLGVLPDEGNLERGAVVGQDLAAPVEDEPPRRGSARLPGPVGLGTGPRTCRNPGSGSSSRRPGSQEEAATAKTRQSGSPGGARRQVVIDSSGIRRLGSPGLGAAARRTNRRLAQDGRYERLDEESARRSPRDSLADDRRDEDPKRGQLEESDDQHEKSVPALGDVDLPRDEAGAETEQPSWTDPARPKTPSENESMIRPQTAPDAPRRSRPCGPRRR